MSGRSRYRGQRREREPGLPLLTDKGVHLENLFRVLSPPGAEVVVTPAKNGCNVEIRRP